MIIINVNNDNGSYLNLFVLGCVEQDGADVWWSKVYGGSGAAYHTPKHGHRPLRVRVSNH